MYQRKEHLIESFQTDQCPKYLCHNCEIGRFHSDKIILKEDSESERWKESNIDEWEPEFMFGVFHMSMICNNSECKEVVFVAGKYNVELQIDELENGRELECYIDTISPSYMSPPIWIIKRPNKLPKNLLPFIKESEQLFWISSSGTLNSIRTILERILDNWKVKKSQLSKSKNGKSKRNYLSLHHRIEAFRKIKPEPAEILLAVKWLGNHGSHSGNIKREDVIDAMELLQRVLNLLYDDSEKELLAKGRMISKRKGPLKR